MYESTRQHYYNHFVPIGYSAFVAQGETSSSTFTAKGNNKSSCVTSQARHHERCAPFPTHLMRKRMKPVS